MGVGMADWLRPPLPPNRVCGSPAHGSPVDGSPPRGLTRRRMDGNQTMQPLVGKEGVGPAVEIPPLGHAPTLAAFALDRTQPSADPAVQRDGRRSPVWASPFGGRLAGSSSRIKFACVTDWPFASRYSPPRLAATQFRSATSRRASTWKRLPPFCQNALTDVLAAAARPSLWLQGHTGCPWRPSIQIGLKAHT